MIFLLEFVPTASEYAPLTLLCFAHFLICCVFLAVTSLSLELCFCASCAKRCHAVGSSASGDKNERNARVCVGQRLLCAAGPQPLGLRCSRIPSIASFICRGAGRAEVVQPGPERAQGAPTVCMAAWREGAWLFPLSGTH